ncbi:MAG TPA: transposase, partial [Lachnospiraceae bacterium]|nr:transposase [Lachnospiraceae bacterium]
MGRKDTITKKYLSRPEVFADAFNYLMFEGKKVIRPGDLEEQDPTEAA